jgi:hypothetical protein
MRGECLYVREKENVLYIGVYGIMYVISSSSGQKQPRRYYAVNIHLSSLGIKRKSAFFWLMDLMAISLLSFLFLYDSDKMVDIIVLKQKNSPTFVMLAFFSALIRVWSFNSLL